jgi:hypothetical protein
LKFPPQAAVSISVPHTAPGGYGFDNAGNHPGTASASILSALRARQTHCVLHFINYN